MSITGWASGKKNFGVATGYRIDSLDFVAEP
jgi:hypothetical protein